MRVVWCVPTVILLLFGLTGCGAKKTTGPQAAEITGSWIATRVEYVSKTTSDDVDLIAAGGSGELVLNANNTYEFTLAPSGGISNTTTGRWTLSGDLITMTESGMAFSVVFDITLSGSTLRMTGGDAEYDFNHDGTPEPANLNLAFRR